MSGARAFGWVLVLSSCVGLPPPPPGQADGSGTVTGDSDGSDGDTGPAVSTTLAGDTGVDTGIADTGPSLGVCGDAVVEGDEECDLGGDNGQGDYCTNDCTFNVCGDGYAGPGEACDDGNTNDDDQCTSMCGLPSCGNGMLEGLEECDEGENNSPSGACLPSCLEAECGDQNIWAGIEMCDGSELGGETCASLGYDSGILGCTAACTFDTSVCYACGNGSLEPGEVCDGMNLAGETCLGLGLGFDGGTLGCENDCTYDLSGCFNCGDGVVNGPEQCDGMDLDGQTCGTVAGMGYGGALSCAADCTFDTSDCCFMNGMPCMSNANCCSGNCGGRNVCQ